MSAQDKAFDALISNMTYIMTTGDSITPENIAIPYQERLEKAIESYNQIIPYFEDVSPTTAIQHTAKVYQVLTMHLMERVNK